MIDDGRELLTSDVERLDELSAGERELSKEELDSVYDLLLEVLVVNSESCVSDWLARLKDLVDFSSNLAVVDTLNIGAGELLWLLLMGGGVLVLLTVVAWIGDLISFKKGLWLETFVLGN